MKYARIVDGRVVDPVVIPSGINPQEYVTKIFPGLTGFVEVPENTLPGASDNGDGTYTNPTPPTPVTTYKILSKTAFQDYAITVLGGGLTGMTRFMEIMNATKNSASGPVQFAWERYNAASSFEKDNTDLLTDVMLSDTITSGHIVQSEKDDLISNWPTQSV